MSRYSPTVLPQGFDLSPLMSALSYRRQRKDDERREKKSDARYDAGVARQDAADAERRELHDLTLARQSVRRGSAPDFSVAFPEPPSFGDFGQSLMRELGGGRQGFQPSLRPSGVTKPGGATMLGGSRIEGPLAEAVNFAPQQRMRVGTKAGYTQLTPGFYQEDAQTQAALDEIRRDARRQHLLRAGVPETQVDAALDNPSLTDNFLPQQRQPSEVNWQLVEGADGYYQVNPRTGERRRIEGMRPPERMVGGASIRATLPTEGERKASAFYTSGKQGYDTLERVLSQGKGVPSWTDRQVARIGMGGGNMMTGDEYRQMRQAALQLSDAWLRYTSGAAVPEQEVERFAQAFIPEPGDDEQTLRQKSEARQTIILALRRASGRAMPQEEEGADDEGLPFPRTPSPRASSGSTRRW